MLAKFARSPSVVGASARRLSSVSSISGASSIRQHTRLQQQARQHQLERTQQGRRTVEARVRDPDAADDLDSKNELPSFLTRFLASTIYLIPWIDILILSIEFLNKFRSLHLLYFLPAPLMPLYYSNPFAPLVIFFLVFLAIVRNNKLHHFVRFNAMQAIMIDIVIMLVNIIRMYMPAEIRWSVIMILFDRFAYVTCIAAILYCVYFTLRGKYADVPYVSEAVYMQVDMMEST